MTWLTREVGGRLVAILAGAAITLLVGAGLLPHDARLCVGQGAPLVKPSVSSSSTKVLVEPLADLPGSPVWSGSRPAR